MTIASTRDDEAVSLAQDSLALYQALTRLARVYQFRDREQVCFRGISVTECYSLTALVWYGPMTLNQLATTLYLDKSTVSRVVDAMESKGLVRRRPHPDSRRAIELSPSAKGRRLCTTMQNEMVERQRGLLAEYTPETRSAMIDFIDRLAEQAEERTRGARNEVTRG